MREQLQRVRFSPVQMMLTDTIEQACHRAAPQPRLENTLSPRWPSWVLAALRTLQLPCQAVLTASAWLWLSRGGKRKVCSEEPVCTQ